MATHYGRIQISRYNPTWMEASIIWPALFGYQSEDESLVLSFFVVWKYLEKQPVQKQTPIIWQHVMKNVDIIAQKWVNVPNNTFIIPEMKYFTQILLQVILDLVWRSNINITVLRRFGAALVKGAREIEEFQEGGFLKLTHVREITQAR